jgi:N-acetylglutamate synthase-like GNAT family acetyltransferase
MRETSISMSKATNRDTDRIIELSSDELGKGYIILEQIQFFINDAQTNINTIKINDEVIGFVIVQQIDKSGLLLNYKVQIESEKSILLIRSIVIDKNYSGKGFGTTLLSYTLENASFKYDELLSINWKRGDVIPFQSMSENLGMQACFEIKNYWTKDSLQRGSECPECGKICKCSAVIF